MNKNTSRREFLRTSAAATAGLLATTGGLRAQKPSANDTIHVACIGVGGKGEADTDGMIRGGARLVALCDVDDDRAKDTYKRYPDVRRFHDYREMLDKMHKDIDAVVVTTPDHMHAIQTMAAMLLGKHVYTQKPLTHDVAEARLLTTTAAERRIVTQMGNEGTASDALRSAIETLRAGAIGPVREVHAWTNRPVWPQGAQALLDHQGVKTVLHGEARTAAVPSTLKWDLWLGTAPARPYDPIYAPFNWRGWWDFGTGAMGDMACHVINMPFIALRLGAPTTIEAQTAPDLNGETYPSWSIIRYEFPARGEFPPVTMTWYDGGANSPEWVMRRLEELYGSKKVPNTGYVCVGDKGRLASAHNHAAHARLLPEDRFADYKRPAPTLPRVDCHYREWLEACRAGKPNAPMSNFATAGPLTEVALLGCLAMRVGKKLEWDGPAMKVTNVPEANAFLKREYRKGWSL